MENKRETPKKIFLVDYENVSIKGLEGIEKLNPGDSVYILYSKITSQISMDLLSKLSNLKIEIHFVKTVSGKNALDFVLSSLLGYLIKEFSTEASYYIISNDKGYEPLLSYWNDNTIKLIATISSISNNKKETVIKETQNNNNIVKPSVDECLKGTSKEIIDKVKNIILETKSKQAVKNSLKNLLKNDSNANEVYSKISKLVEDKK